MRTPIRELVDEEDWDENCPVCVDAYDDFAWCMICGRDGSYHQAEHPHVGLEWASFNKCPGFVQESHIPYVITDLGAIERSLRS